MLSCHLAHYSFSDKNFVIPAATLDRARACATMSLSTSPILAAAASNDLHTVRWLVERESVPVDCSADWLVPDSSGVNKSGEQRGLDAGRKQLERDAAHAADGRGVARGTRGVVLPAPRRRRSQRAVGGCRAMHRDALRRIRDPP